MIAEDILNVINDTEQSLLGGLNNRSDLLKHPIISVKSYMQQQKNIDNTFTTEHNQLLQFSEQIENSRKNYKNENENESDEDSGEKNVDKFIKK